MQNKKNRMRKLTDQYLSESNTSTVELSNIVLINHNPLNLSIDEWKT